MPLIIENKEIPPSSKYLETSNSSNLSMDVKEVEDTNKNTNLNFDDSFFEDDEEKDQVTPFDSIKNTKRD